jgi:hypothetical protein
MRTNTEFEQRLTSYIIDNIDSYIGTKLEDLHHQLFNTDYYVIGYYQAEQELLTYGSVFEAIGDVQKYERKYYGVVFTDLSSSESVCNMLAYIVGEQVINNLDIELDGELTEEIAEQIKEQLK